MVCSVIPKDAKWLTVEYVNPEDHSKGKLKVMTFGAWLLSEDAENFYVLDSFAQEYTVPKKDAKLRPRGFAEDVKDLQNVAQG